MTKAEMLDKADLIARSIDGGTNADAGKLLAAVVAAFFAQCTEPTEREILIATWVTVVRELANSIANNPQTKH